MIAVAVVSLTMGALGLFVAGQTLAEGHRAVVQRDPLTGWGLLFVGLMLGSMSLGLVAYVGRGLLDAALAWLAGAL